MYGVHPEYASTLGLVRLQNMYGRIVLEGRFVHKMDYPYMYGSLTTLTPTLVSRMQQDFFLLSPEKMVMENLNKLHYSANMKWGLAAILYKFPAFTEFPAKMTSVIIRQIMHM